MKSAAVLCLTACLCLHAASAARAHPKQATPALRASTPAAKSAPHPALYKSDCFKKRPVFLVEGSKVNTSAAMIPGAGMEPSAIVPFQTVLKDGYYYVDCFKDHMYYFGDKFGDHKYDYALGGVSNVSIVNYDDMVPKQDQEPMNQATCFAFCRTVPDMGFFGISNGRSCYCMPYLKQMAGDSSQCDATCEGDKASTCGGKTKSSIFEMHMCQQTFEDLMGAESGADSASTAMSAKSVKLTGVANDMKSEAETLQETCGRKGDPECSALAQLAKVEAGKLLEATGAADALATEITEMKTKAGTMLPAGSKPAPLGHDEAEAAEALTKSMLEATTKVEEETETLTGLLVAASPDLLNGTSDDTKALYKDVMYFVNKSFLGKPTTCSGKPVAAPMVGSLEGCAVACEEYPHDCTAFQWFSSELCFLFSKLTGLMYYTGCPDGQAEEVCMVKYSEYDGTTLAPDASGKCAGCLKTADEAARCLY